MSGDLRSSLSRLSNHGQYDNFEAGYDDPLHVSPYSLTSFSIDVFLCSRTVVMLLCMA